ncbi:MAG TPA: hypothetical protein VKN36_11345 [Eudoraea sp.]|nr:hypothetical protein [Eudoraea sp.]
MKSILRFLSWQWCLNLSVGVLILSIILNFYGLYSNKFYLLKPDNYIFPVLTIFHFVYLYVFWFKIRERELPDPQMRNLEYAMYAIVLVYTFKILDTLYILTTYSDYENHIMPATFIPIGIFILIIQIVLLLLTIITFFHRKERVGDYNFDNINENIDSWQ